MAFTTYGNTATASTSIRARIAARFDALRASFANWRVYHATYTELSELSNRDLADLGMSRSMIKSVAMEAAYGK